jgi:hypothetical protein
MICDKYGGKNTGPQCVKINYICLDFTVFWHNSINFIMLIVSVMSLVRYKLWDEFAGRYLYDEEGGWMVNIFVKL